MVVHTYYRDGDRVDVVEGAHIRSVPLEAVATRVELLGYTDPADGLAACLAEMGRGEDDDSHPYDQVYEAYLPYLRRERGYRDIGDPKPFTPQEGRSRTVTAGAVPAADTSTATLVAALETARRRACAELGAPEPGSSVARSGRPMTITMSGVAAAERSGMDSTPSEDSASHMEVLDRLRSEPLITELREEFRDQLVPPMNPRGNA